jgi:WD40 repeat protein
LLILNEENQETDFIAIGFSNGFIQITDYVTQTNSNIYQMHTNEITSLEHLKNTEKCLSSTISGNLKIWTCLQAAQSSYLNSFNSSMSIKNAIYLP